MNMEKAFNNLKKTGIFGRHSSYKSYKNRNKIYEEECPYDSVQKESQEAIQDQNNEDREAYGD